MEKKFSTNWKSSKQPRKQRKYRANAPVHVRPKFLSAPLSKELRKQYNTRSLRVRKGDKVTVVRGSFRKKIGKVDRVSVKKAKVFVTGFEITKKDGNKVLAPIDPSNIIITELYDEDKRRISKLKKKSEDKTNKAQAMVKK